MSQNLSGNQTFDAAVGTLVTAAGGTLNGAKLHLGQTNLTIDRNTDLATLVAQVATFDGYASKVIVWTGPFLNESGQIEMVGMPAAAWSPSGTVTPNVIYNCWVTNAGASVLYLAGPLDGAPISMASALNYLTVVVRYNPRTGGVTINYY